MELKNGIVLQILVGPKFGTLICCFVGVRDILWAGHTEYSLIWEYAQDEQLSESLSGNALLSRNISWVWNQWFRGMCELRVQGYPPLKSAEIAMVVGEFQDQSYDGWWKVSMLVTKRTNKWRISCNESPFLFHGIRDGNVLLIPMNILQQSKCHDF